MWRIAKDEKGGWIQEDGSISASDESGFVGVVQPAAGENAKAFVRRAIRKNLRTGETQHLDVLVLELDGVRAYVDLPNKAVILTRKDHNI